MTACRRVAHHTSRDPIHCNHCNYWTVINLHCIHSMHKSMNLDIITTPNSKLRNSVLWFPLLNIVYRLYSENTFADLPILQKCIHMSCGPHRPTSPRGESHFSPAFCARMTYHECAHVDAERWELRWCLGATPRSRGPEVCEGRELNVHLDLHTNLLHNTRG